MRRGNGRRWSVQAAEKNLGPPCISGPLHTFKSVKGIQTLRLELKWYMACPVRTQLHDAP